LIAQVLDRETGEIFSSTAPASGDIVPWDDHSYSSLEDAETSIYALLEQGEHLRLQQTKILLAIQRQELFRERVDVKTGQPYSSFDTYIKGFLGSAAGFSNDSPRTLRSWLSRYLVFVEDLNLPEESLIEMGSHFEVLITAAAKSRQCELLEQNEDLPTGGARLGRSEFQSLTQEIMQCVEQSRANPDVPELHWTIRDTRDRVAEILGNADEKANFELTGTPVGDDKVHWDSVVGWVDDLQYRVGDTMPLHVWTALTKGHKAVGVEE